MYKLKGNFALCIAGPSNSGKTSFCVKLLNHSDQMFEKKFQKFFWILGDPNAQPTNLTVPVQFIVGIPEIFENTTGYPHLYVLDDSMFETQNKAVANLFTRGCHHQNISVIFITQNLFHQGRYSRDISLNFSHLCLLKNPRDPSQFLYLARQIYPENPRELTDLYKRITQQPYTYLFIDLSQNTHDLLRFRGDIFNPYYSTIFCSKIPTTINGETVNHEMCEKGSAYSTCFEKQQL